MANAMADARSRCAGDHWGARDVPEVGRGEVVCKAVGTVVGGKTGPDGDSTSITRDTAAGTCHGLGVLWALIRWAIHLRSLSWRQPATEVVPFDV